MTHTVAVEEDIFGRLKPEEAALHGHVPTGCGEVELVRRFTLCNKNNMHVQVITYGAALTAVKLPDRNGKVVDVMLGYDNLQGYLNDQYYMGSTVGRVANRIANGTFSIQNHVYTLSRNDGSHHLHGGVRGFSKVLWESHVAGSTVNFTYASPSWEEGYPGTVMCQVSYRLTDNNEIVMEHRATASHFTPFNTTNHSYFNLGGHDSGPVYNHLININADHYTPVDETLIPTGETAPVKDTPFDLGQLVSLSQVVSGFSGKGMDHNFCINGQAGTLRPAARVTYPPNGLIMEVFTTQPGIQFYMGNFLPDDGSLHGKGGAVYKKHGGFCLETQNYPDAINKPAFPSCIIGPGNSYRHVTVYRFSTSSP